MTRKRFSRIERACLIRLINQSDKKAMKAANKTVYRAEFPINDGLRRLGVTSYQQMYDETISHMHRRMIRGEL